MRLLDIFGNSRQERKERSHLFRLRDRLAQYLGSLPRRREDLQRRVIEQAHPALSHDPSSLLFQAVSTLLHNILTFEGLLLPPAPLPQPLTTAHTWEAIKETSRALSAVEDPYTENRIIETLAPLIATILPAHLPPHEEEGAAALAAPLLSFIPKPAEVIEGAIGIFLGGPRDRTLFPNLWQQLEWNLLSASGINPEKASSRAIVPPTKAKDKAAPALVSEYLGRTPLQAYFETAIPFVLPLAARFEHCHVVGGSGHGKTQLLQSFIMRDIDRLIAGKGSIIVIDSQGDMIKTILGLAGLSSLSDRIILIDPNDIENPPCLNLFDFGLDRLTHYSAVDREKLVNGAIALYEYMFGALLGADLTQRQGVIFRYLARLMMVVPGATIHTLREFMEHPETTRPYLSKLDPTSKIFFETQFFSKVYDDTRRQILTRLWGVIANSVLARMFAHPRNRVDLFAAMNRGSLILINAAKDLLKQDGCESLGRFFLALIAQATQERAALPEERRRATFLYIDEAQDYFDEGMEQLLNQARKYRVGLILAHQNRGQFEPRLQAAVMASTAIKLAGGVSAKDAATLAREMRCAPEFLQEMRKRQTHTEFACFIRNLTPCPIRLSIPFGQMDSRPRMNDSELQSLLRENARRYCAGSSELTQHAPAPDANEMGQPEVL